MADELRSLLLEKPAPPPEAPLIRRARKAAGMQIAQAAAAARGHAPSLRLGTVRWSQIELGYETKPGGYVSVTASDTALAHMASVVGVTPERLAEAGREDAADVLREIIRQRTEPVPMFLRGGVHDGNGEDSAEEG